MVYSPVFGSIVKVLALDPIPQTAKDAFSAALFQVDECFEELNEAQLLKKVSDYSIVCLSKDRDHVYLTDEVLRSAHRLFAIAVFARDISQIEVQTATSMGIPVFAAPYQHVNAASELVISFIILLARKCLDRSTEIHSGVWNKKSDGCHEVRGKTLGIVGYGHVGSQVGVLAEALSLKVLFYDTLSLMPIGRAQSVDSLNQLLSKSDFVAINVSESLENRNLISTEQLNLMPQGSYLINTSYQQAVDLDALAEALKSNHLAGAALDATNATLKGQFKHALTECENVILTPMISSKTSECYIRSGTQVSNSVIKYIKDGSTVGSENFPSIAAWPLKPNTTRIVNIHCNVRGFLREMDNILSAYNVGKQVLDTREKIGYLIADISTENVSSEIVAQIAMLSNTIRTRIL